jgi:hypothetical protein
LTWWRAVAAGLMIAAAPRGGLHEPSLFVKLIITVLGHMDEWVVGVAPPTGRARYPLGSILAEIGNTRLNLAESLPGG